MMGVSVHLRSLKPGPEGLGFNASDGSGVVAARGAEPNQRSLEGGHGLGVGFI